VRGGRRVAAAHTGELLYAAIWPSPEMPAAAGGAANGLTPISPADLQRGLVVLAEALHDEVARSLNELEAAWPPAMIEHLVNDITAIATRLRG
jgi:hypothetical protein